MIETCTFKNSRNKPSPKLKRPKGKPLQRVRSYLRVQSDSFSDNANNLFNKTEAWVSASSRFVDTWFQFDI